MEIYNWYKDSSDEILFCSDKQKLIKALIKQEVKLREMLGFKNLTKEEIKKLSHLMEIKYLVSKKTNSESSESVTECLEKCEEEIRKLRSGSPDVLIILEEQFFSAETKEIQEILKQKSFSNPIISKLLS